MRHGIHWWTGYCYRCCMSRDYDDLESQPRRRHQPPPARLRFVCGGNTAVEFPCRAANPPSPPPPSPPSRNGTLLASPAAFIPPPQTQHSHIQRSSPFGHIVSAFWDDKELIGYIHHTSSEFLKHELNLLMHLSNPFVHYAFT